MRGLPLMIRREPKPEPGPSTATGRVKRPCQSRSALTVSYSVRSRADSALARRSDSGSRSTM